MDLDDLFDLELSNNEPMKRNFKEANDWEKAEIIRMFLDASNVSKRLEHVEKSPKNNNVSKNKRMKGNELFQSNKFEEAIEMYNEAICYAEIGSEQLGIVYANRSAVYYLMGLHEECLKSINLAKQSNYPEHLMPKIMKREKESLELIKKTPKETLPKKREFKLSYPANKKIPFIVDCIELKKSTKYGRGLYATEEIHAGDVLIIEEVSVSNLYNEEMYRRCSYCLNKKHKNLIPCNFCTKAMYCSDDCKDKAWNDSHEFECEIADELFPDPHETISLKPIWIALKAFDNSVDKWIKYFESTDRDKIHNLKIDYTNLSKKDRYKAILGLCPTKNLCDKTIVSCGFAAYSLHARLLNKLRFRNIFQQDYQKDFLFKMLFLNSCIKANFCYGIDETQAKSWSQMIQENANINTIAVAWHSVASLFNHSCANNIEILVDKLRVVIYATRNIKKGEQLFCTYGFRFSHNELNSRRASLKEKYGFDCDCEACINDYPNSEKLVQLAFFAGNIGNISNNEYKSDEEIKACFEFLDKNGHNYKSLNQILLRNSIDTQYQYDVREY